MRSGNTPASAIAGTSSPNGDDAECARPRNAASQARALVEDCAPQAEMKVDMIGPVPEDRPFELFGEKLLRRERRDLEIDRRLAPVAVANGHLEVEPTAGPQDHDPAEHSNAPGFVIPAPFHPRKRRRVK